MLRRGRPSSAVDGLVLTGGSDVDPARYGAEAHITTDVPRVERDEWELALTRAALAADRPVLAVCRGLQILNVALGGDLIQHLPETVGHEDHRPQLGNFGGHRISFATGLRDRPHLRCRRGRSDPSPPGGRRSRRRARAHRLE